MNNKTGILFREEELEKITDKGKSSIVISNKAGKTLTKNQQTFNNLTKQIESLNEKINTTKVKLDTLLTEYNKEIYGTEKTIAEKQILVAKALSDSTDVYKFGKKQFENISEVITDLCDQAFSVIEPDEETEDFYNTWADNTYADDLEDQMDYMKDFFQDQIKQMTGKDIDLSDVDFNNPEDVFSKFGEIKDKLIEDELNEPQQPKRERKKTKKQLEREILNKKEEELKNKSLKTIYFSLAKVLHPDTELDPQQKIEKEELMKQVTQAYQKKDLPTLLKLEMQWVASETGNIEKLSDEQLKIYNSFLKEQVDELNSQLYSLHYDPTYSNVSRFCFDDIKTGMKKIKSEKNLQMKRINLLDGLLSMIRTPKNKTSIVYFINDYIDQIKYRNNDFSFDKLITLFK